MERSVVSLTTGMMLAVATGALLLVAILDLASTRRELMDAAASLAPRIEASMRAGAAAEALAGIPSVAHAKLYGADGKLLAETPPAPPARSGLAATVASRLLPGEIACNGTANGQMFCTELSATPLIIRIRWWFGILGTAALGSALLGWLTGLALQRSMVRRLEPIRAAIARATSNRDYSERVAVEPGAVGLLSGAVNELLTQVQDQEVANRRRALEIEAANKELEGFAYAVSHDLRAPLGSVDGFTQALRDEYGERLDDAGREYIGWILEGCRQMRELIEGLLEMTRLARAELSEEDVDLSSLAQSVAEQLRQLAPDREVAFAIDGGVRTTGDPRLLRAVLENLMGNAFKFTRGRQDARIEFGTKPAGEGQAFYVRDNGVGFDPAQAAKMFRPFQRLHSQRDFEGTGIGLATVQKIIARHNGKAWAEGEPGKGATVYFTAALQPTVSSTGRS